MPQVFAVWTAATLMLSLGGLTAVVRDGGDSAVASSAQGINPKVSPDGRYFVDQNGKPVFWLGTTQWQLFNP
jgi:Protein of unknown function (DUF4038)